MLYNSYRPIKYSEVIGQASAAILLKQSIKERPGHSYLFHGASGSGKTTTARILAMSLNCNSKVNGEPCGKCGNCIDIIKQSHIDVIEMDGGKSRGIADIKDLCTKAQYYPNMGKSKVYIIDECHNLTPEAWGAMLHLLEEPPAQTVIILCTTDKSSIPATITSRCQQYEFTPIAPADIARRLMALAMAEDEAINADAINQIADNVNGNMRQAETMLEQVLCAA
jgi:DNA polymerase-3 subunit gamma/tau